MCRSLCRSCCRSRCCSNIWWVILTRVFGWTFVNPFWLNEAGEPKYDSGVVGLLPHTSNWDFTLAPLMFCINAKAAVKSSLSFLLYFGFPVHPVVRKDSGEASTAGNQTKSLGDSLKQDAGWLALWLSGYVGVVVVVCVVLGAARIGKEVVCGVVGLCVVSWCYCVVVVSWCLVVSWCRGAVVSSGCGVVV